MCKYSKHATYRSLAGSSWPSLNHFIVGSGLPSTTHFSSKRSPSPTSAALSSFLANVGDDCSRLSWNLASVTPTMLVATAAYYTKNSNCYQAAHNLKAFGPYSHTSPASFRPKCSSRMSLDTWLSVITANACLKSSDSIFWPFLAQCSVGCGMPSARTLDSNSA